MKIHILASFTVAFLLPNAPLLHAQPGGSLTPPGAPGQTFKSLDEMEPRTPLVDGAPGVAVGPSGTITISQPGSYYLTGSFTVTSGDGITIDADYVTLDLRGFTITSTSATADGAAIQVNSDNIRIYNGHIDSGVTWDGSVFSAGPGFIYGIIAVFASNINIHVREVSFKGILLDGIRCSVGDNSIVESCTGEVCGYYGIQAGLVRNCAVGTTGYFAIWGEQVIACRGESVGFAGIGSVGPVSDSYGVSYMLSEPVSGIAAQDVINSYGGSNSGHGIVATNNVVNSCGVSGAVSGSKDGISASRNVVNSYGHSNSGDGIKANGSASNSYGITDSLDAGSHGIEATNVTGSYGFAEIGHGIDAKNVVGSHGFAYSGHGIYATSSVLSSSGESAGGCGIRTSLDFSNGGVVSNSTGISSGPDADDHGIHAYFNVTGSYGSSANGDGIQAANIMCSYGYSTGDDGIQASRVVSYSTGRRNAGIAGAHAIEAPLVIGCGRTGTVSATTEYFAP